MCGRTAHDGAYAKYAIGVEGRRIGRGQVAGNNNDRFVALYGNGMVLPGGIEQARNAGGDIANVGGARGQRFVGERLQYLGGLLGGLLVGSGSREILAGDGFIGAGEDFGVFQHELLRLKYTCF